MKLKKLIRYSTQHIDNSDISAVNKVLKSDFLTEGPIIEKFEKKLCNYTKSKNAVAVNSASTGLIIACQALDLKKNDYLWTTPITFVSSANCAFYFKAKVDFVDINKDSFNIDIDELEKKLIISKRKKKLPKILIIVHLGGNPVDLKRIKSLSNKYNFSIIEDASHALGSKYRNIKIGNCKYSDIAVLSFHPVKSITTGEGGAVLTNKTNLNQKIKVLRSHGIVKEKLKLDNKNMPNFYYEQKYLSSNYRMTAIQAALGLSQMSRLDKFIKKRNMIAKIYNRELPKNIFDFQLIRSKDISSRHLFIVRLKNKLRNKFYNYLMKNNIQTNLHYIPVYRHPYYKNIKIDKKDFFNSEEYYSKAISIPIHFNLTKNQQRYIIKKIKFFFKK